MGKLSKTDGAKSTEAEITRDMVKVTRAKEFEAKEGTAVGFDMVVNGVTIYGCVYREGTSKAGKEYNMISFPSHKGQDGKYYSYAFFKVTSEVLDEVVQQISTMV